MSFLEWLQWVWALCTSAEPFPAWREIGIVSNLAIAVAYYWIPVVMVIVFRRWKREIPFPLIWTGFVAFILACGTSHVVHAFHGLRPMAPYSNSELLVLGSTALVSLATAGAFTMLLPQIMRFTSPTTAAARLQVEVDKATAELRRALELEKLLVREVHHRVKNNLQATASLINLHIRRSKQADVSELGALRDRITAMSQAHEQLQEVSSTPFSTKTLIANLCELHRTAYHREGVRCRVVGDDLTVPFEAATSLSLILNEAVSNALKHGFGVGERGIVVACVSVGSGGAVIRIRDNGRGIAAETDNSGIGMTLIHSLAVQVNGTAELKRRRGRGSEFVLTLDGAFGHDSVDVAPSVGRRPASPIAAPESTVA